MRSTSCTCQLIRQVVVAIKQSCHSYSRTRLWLWGKQAIGLFMLHYLLLFMYSVRRDRFMYLLWLFYSDNRGIRYSWYVNNRRHCAGLTHGSIGHHNTPMRLYILNSRLPTSCCFYYWHIFLLQTVFYRKRSTSLFSTMYRVMIRHYYTRSNSILQIDFRT